MKRHGSFIAIIILSLSLVFFAIWALHKSRGARVGATSQASSSTRQMRSQGSSTRATPPSQGDEAGVPAGPPALAVANEDATRGHDASSDPQFLVVRQMLRDYRAALGENPVGTNSEITKALLGANSRKARFIASEARLNSAHQLVDRWDHPYFFHQLSRSRTEIRSAGPDGRMWTSDDQISANVSLPGKIFEASGTRIR